MTTSDLPGQSRSLSARLLRGEGVSLPPQIRYTLAGAIFAAALTHQMRQGAQELKVTLSELEFWEHELAQANRRLASLTRAKTAFFSNVSREFRTPLTLVLGPLEILLAQPSVGQVDEIADSIKLVRLNALRLLRVVNALLDFSQLEGGKDCSQPAVSVAPLKNYWVEVSTLSEGGR